MYVAHPVPVTIANRILVDYNSWIESDKGRRLADTLPKDTILAEGYKQYDTGRTYLVKLGDWRKNKDEEVSLDGVGGVNILVKADVHRAGMSSLYNLQKFHISY
jgi:hypothetical protein